MHARFRTTRKDMKTYYCCLLKKSDHLSYINGTLLNGTTIRAYLDTGSEMTIISSQYVTNKAKIKSVHNINLLSATGHHLNLLGQYTLPIYFGNHRFHILCMVVENFPYPLLLSHKTFRELRAIINYDENKCTFKFNDSPDCVVHIFSDASQNKLVNLIRAVNRYYVPVLHHCLQDTYNKHMYISKLYNKRYMLYLLSQPLTISKDELLLLPIHYTNTLSFSSHLHGKLVPCGYNSNGIFFLCKSTTYLPDGTLVAKVALQKQQEKFHTMKNGELISCQLQKPECTQSSTKQDHDQYTELISENTCNRDNILSTYKYCITDSYEIPPLCTFELILPLEVTNPQCSYRRPLFDNKKILLVQAQKNTLKFQNKSPKSQQLHKNTTVCYTFVNHLQAEKDGFSETEIAELKRLKRIADFNIKHFYVNEELPQLDKNCLIRVIRRRCSVFTQCDDYIHYCNHYITDVVLIDDIPVFVKPYKASMIECQIMEQIIQRNVTRTIARPCFSEWNNPLILVNKRSDQSYVDTNLVNIYKEELLSADAWRLVIDLSKLNKKVARYPTNIQNIQDIINSIGDKKYVSMLDVSSAFLSIPLTERSQKYFAFSVYNCPYQWKMTRLPFGFALSPLEWLRAIQKCLETPYYCPKTGKHITENVRETTRYNIFLYMDDLIILSRTIEEQCYYLDILLQQFAACDFCIRGSKCKFAVTQYKMLGVLVTPHGLSIENSKIEAIKKMRVPQSQEELRSVCGTFSYHRSFVHYFAHIIQPLYEMTKKDVKFQWTELHQKAFDTLKLKLINHPYLALYNYEYSHILRCDASKVGISAVLAQIQPTGEERVVYYFSRVLTPQEQKWNIVEIELLAIVTGFVKFHHLLALTFTTVYTDNISLKHIDKLSHGNARLTRLALKLQPYHFEIKHVKGVNNKLPDYLSRYPYEKTEKEKYHDKILSQKVHTLPGLSIKEHDYAINLLTFYSGMDNLYYPVDGSEKSFMQFNDPNTHLCNAVTRSQTKTAAEQTNTTEQVTGTSELSSSPLCSELVQTPICTPQNEQISQTNFVDLSSGIFTSTKLQNSDFLYNDEETDIEKSYNTRLKRRFVKYYSKTEDKCPTNMTVSITHFHIREQQNECSYYSAIINSLKANIYDDSTYGYYYHPELQLLYKTVIRKGNEVHLLVIPDSLISHVLFAVHTGIFGSHAGKTRVYQYIHDRYYIRNLQSHIDTYINHCKTCAFFKAARTKTPGFLMHLLPDQGHTVLSKLYVDWIGPTKASSRLNKYVFVIVDQVSRYSVAYASRTNSAEDTARCLMEYICTYSAPTVIVQDNGSSFQNDTYKALLRMIGATPIFCSPYHPQGNAIVERLNKSLISHLKTHVSFDQRDWDLNLKPCLLGLNSKYNRSLLYSPFEVLYGRKATIPSLEQFLQFDNCTLQQHQQRLQKIRAAAHQNLLTSLAKSKANTDLHRRAPHPYKIGDYCMVSFPLQTTQHSDYGMLSKKWKAEWKGIYQIVKQSGPLTWHLKLVNTTKPQHASKPLQKNDEQIAHSSNPMHSAKQLEEKIIIAHVSRMKPLYVSDLSLMHD
jgi:RNase H-like domain found in reverse transcriptase/Reverse transcriptase (RNA-dependent DNA polymerase)/Integrase core domain/Integrase zinc binding domain